MKRKLPPGTLRRMWEDPENWRGFSYRCEDDPRIIVPKRMALLGWTINWAHGQAAMTCFFGIVFIVAILGAAAVTRNQEVEVGATVLVIIGVVGMCYWLADTSRFEDGEE